MTEKEYEKSIIQLFEEMGYHYIENKNIKHDYKNTLYIDDLKKALNRINPMLPENAIFNALNTLLYFENGELVQQNSTFMGYLQNGIEVQYDNDKGERCNDICNLIDYDHKENNSFIITNQWRISENEEKRIDLLLFINGLPLVLMELKSPIREEAKLSDAYNQIRNYMQVIPSIFIYNAICVISNLSQNCAGTITSNESRFMEWKSEDGKYENTEFAQFETFFKGMFQKERLLDILKNFILFSNDGIHSNKILACYHQYFAVRKAIESTKKAINSDHKGGVFWHTQGSGKSLSMVFYAHLLQYEVKNSTIVIITDRNDLDHQLYSQFVKCKDFLRQEPKQAQNREDLKELLNKRKVNGIIFTTMQKFKEWENAFSERKDIIVIADEAHRGQYGLAEKIKTITNEQGEIIAKEKIGMARMIRDALPNATYIGFTGTPISKKDRDTREVFGDYIDIYDMTQAVHDGATCPIYYESRIIKLQLDENILQLIDAEYEAMAKYTDPYVIEKSKRKLGNMEAILGHDDTIKSLVDDILKHYENYRKNLPANKAMIVAYSRAIAIKIYNRILEIRPELKENVAIVITSSNKDPEEWYKIIGSEQDKEKRAIQFKDDTSSLKIAIVVDMWLTGFDVPSLSTMYIYKPMVGHNLMQAIARVNRVFPDKEGGLIVDYVNIITALNQAMEDYSSRDKENYGNMNITDVAYPQLKDKLTICRNILRNYDYSAFFDSDELTKGKIIAGAANFLMDRSRKKDQEIYLKEALILKKTLSVCSSIANKKERDEAAFFEVVRVFIIRILNQGENNRLTLPEVNNIINELLKKSISNDGIIDLFTNKKRVLSLFKPELLEEISNIEEKNLARELLYQLMNEDINLYKHTNIKQSEKFSDRIKKLMESYFANVITNEEVIQEMLNMNKEIYEVQESGHKFGLSVKALAMYDILSYSQAGKDFFYNEANISINEKLIDIIKECCKIDWQERQNIQSGMRVKIKKLLKFYNYPEKEMDNVINKIIEQCKYWSDNFMIA